MDDTLNEYWASTINTSDDFSVDEFSLDGIDITVSAGTQSAAKISDSYPRAKQQPNDKNLTKDALLPLVVAVYDHNGRSTGYQIKSMNMLYDHDLPNIVTNLFSADITISGQNVALEKGSAKSIGYINASVKFTKANIETPRVQDTANALLYPNTARKNNLDYTGSIFVDAVVSVEAFDENGVSLRRLEGEIKDWHIGKIPIMVRSNRCNLYNVSSSVLKEMQEDPSDEGSEFILEGKEYFINPGENLITNYPQYYFNNYGNEITRMTFQSKPGDGLENSQYVIIRYTTDKLITVEMQHNNMAGVLIPYYILFRLFGVVRDDEIFDMILYDKDRQDDHTREWLSTIKRAMDVPIKGDPALEEMRHVTDHSTLMMMFARKIDAHNRRARTGKSAAYNIDYSDRELLDRARRALDEWFLPHIGLDASSRPRKVRYLGYLINILMKVKSRVISQTDRDSFRNKRIAPAGPSLAKAFKQQMSAQVINPIRAAMRIYMIESKFPETINNLISKIKSSVSPQNMEKAMRQNIVSGAEKIVIGGQEHKNRVTGEMLHRKNDINVASAARNFVTHGTNAQKGTERAVDMRMVHPTSTTIVDGYHSTDGGESIGLKKQLTLAASITESSDSALLKAILRADPLFIPLEDIVDMKDIINRKLCNIFVNGDWIGYCEDGAAMAKKYRDARRAGDINRYISIDWALLNFTLSFWCDQGRVYAPHLIVYNNIEEETERYKAARKRGEKTKFRFRQWTKLTSDHIHGIVSGKITFQDLIEQQVFEYIAADELEMCYFAENYDVFRAHENDVEHAYTHVLIEQFMLGIVTICEPNMQHAPATRVTMFVNQKKQSCGWYALNWMHRIDKNVSFQYFCEKPLSPTIGHDLVKQNSMHMILMYGFYGGNNVEDSIIINKSSIARGLFMVSNFHYEMTVVENKELVTIPKVEETVDIKNRHESGYSHLDETGVARPGTVVKRGHILISKVAELSERESVDRKFSDKSIIYKPDDPSYVDAVNVAPNSRGKITYKVKLRSHRPLQIGDKLSSHAGNKSIVAKLVDEASMPYSETGLVVDGILNPHSVPTRMIIGQLIEAVINELSILLGVPTNATGFTNIAMQEVLRILEQDFGMHWGIYRRMFDGQTGEPYDTLIAVAAQAYQRLMKFILDESRYVDSGPTQALTRQPFDGKAKDGGHRLGEMEKDVFISHGISRALSEKFYTHSDGKDIFICRTCGKLAYYDGERKKTACTICREHADVCMVEFSWCSHLYFTMVEAAGVDVTFELEPYIQVLP